MSSGIVIDDLAAKVDKLTLKAARFVICHSTTKYGL